MRRLRRPAVVLCLIAIAVSACLAGGGLELAVFEPSWVLLPDLRQQCPVAAPPRTTPRDPLLARQPSLRAPPAPAVA